MTHYTDNLCPNPSFETDLTGWTALTGTTLSQDASQGFSGHNSMKVVTDGSVSGEGFYGPQATVPSTGTGSMSFYIMGETGTLTVSAISGATATIIASTSVTLSGGDYQRVVLPGLALTATQQMYILVQTPTAQALTLWVDAVQYEMDATPHPYIDGSFPGCAWTGTANESASYQAFQFFTSASGGMYLEGRASPVSHGEVFLTSAEGAMLLSGTEIRYHCGQPLRGPVGLRHLDGGRHGPCRQPQHVEQRGRGFRAGAWDRGVRPGLPPAGRHGVGRGGAVEAGRVRRYRLRLQGDDGERAAEPGVRAVRADARGARHEPGPGHADGAPRQISAIVKPTRLNFCPNPSIETSTAGWVAVGVGRAHQGQLQSRRRRGAQPQGRGARVGDGCYIVHRRPHRGGHLHRQRPGPGGPGPPGRHHGHARGRQPPAPSRASPTAGTPSWTSATARARTAGSRRPGRTCPPASGSARARLHRTRLDA